jgi:hypothetical protein
LKILVNLSGQLCYYYYNYFPKTLVVARNAPKKKVEALGISLYSISISGWTQKKNNTPQTNKPKLWLSEMPRA